MFTELTFAILKYGFLILLWVFVWLTVRSLYKDIETLSPRKSRTPPQDPSGPEGGGLADPGADARHA